MSSILILRNTREGKGRNKRIMQQEETRVGEENWKKMWVPIKRKIGWLLGVDGWWERECFLIQCKQRPKRTKHQKVWTYSYLNAITTTTTNNESAERWKEKDAVSVTQTHKQRFILTSDWNGQVPAARMKGRLHTTARGREHMLHRQGERKAETSVTVYSNLFKIKPHLKFRRWPHSPTSLFRESSTNWNCITYQNESYIFCF